MDLSPKVHAYVKDHIGDRANFLGDLDLPLQIVAHGRRDNVLHDLLHRHTLFDFDNDSPVDDDED